MIVLKPTLIEVFKIFKEFFGIYLMFVENNYDIFLIDWTDYTD